jgi:hypothetical protein
MSETNLNQTDMPSLNKNDKNNIINSENFFRSLLITI